MKKVIISRSIMDDEVVNKILHYLRMAEEMEKTASELSSVDGIEIVDDIGVETPRPSIILPGVPPTTYPPYGEPVKRTSPQRPGDVVAPKITWNKGADRAGLHWADNSEGREE